MLGYELRPGTAPFYVCKYTNSCAIGKISSSCETEYCHLLAHHNKFSALGGAKGDDMKEITERKGDRLPNGYEWMET